MRQSKKDKQFSSSYQMDGVPLHTGDIIYVSSLVATQTTIDDAEFSDGDIMVHAAFSEKSAIKAAQEYFSPRHRIAKKGDIEIIHPAFQVQEVDPPAEETDCVKAWQCTQKLDDGTRKVWYYRITKVTIVAL